MAQGKKYKKQNVRLIAFLLAVLMAGAVLGGVIVGAASAIYAKADRAKYGTRDGKEIKASSTYEYITPKDFTPIECGLPEDLQEYTYYLCEAYYIDFDFAMGLMYTESNFNVAAVSGTNDYGLMQINDCNHKYLTDTLGIDNFTDPYQNIRGGLFLLRGLFEKYDSAAMVCMAYNMGEYGASILWEQGIYETTYSRKVLTKAQEYAEQRGTNA